MRGSSRIGATTVRSAYPRAFPWISPARRHQGILSELSVEFGIHFRDRSCNVCIAPFDGLLPDQRQPSSDEESDTVVQPDLVVVRESAIATAIATGNAPAGRIGERKDLSCAGLRRSPGRV